MGMMGLFVGLIITELVVIFILIRAIKNYRSAIRQLSLRIDQLKATLDQAHKNAFIRGQHQAYKTVQIEIQKIMDGDEDENDEGEEN